MWYDLIVFIYLLSVYYILQNVNMWYDLVAQKKIKK